MAAPDARTVDSYEQTIARADTRDAKKQKQGRRGGWRFAMFLLVLFLLAAGAAAGFYFLIHEPLAREADAAGERVAQLEREAGRGEARLEALAAERQSAVAESERLRGEHAELRAAVEEREAQIAALEEAQREIQERFGAEIASGNLHVTGGEGRLSLGLSDRILFGSGEAELSDQGKALLERMADSLRDIEGRIIQVEGHTDAMRPSAALQERFPTNWELSAARATNVVRFLSEECNIPGDRLVASAFSRYKPAASNRSATGRQRNRRIELNLLPEPLPAPQQ